MNNPLISIIVPVYNVEPYLRRCLDSILAQTFTDWECILVDDGSKDGSGAICDEYAEKDFRFRSIHKENGGVSSARNKGIEVAMGEWIYFSDADDELDENGLKILSEGTKKSSAFVMAGYRKYSESGEAVEICYRRVNKQIPVIEALHDIYIPTDFSFQGYLWCKLFKSKVIKHNRISFCEEVSFNEDQLFVIQYLCVFAEQEIVSYSTEAVYNYWLRGSSAMGVMNRKYNKSFSTQFDAYVLMRNAVFSYTKNKAIRRIALEAIKESYTWHHGLMINSDFDYKIHRKMFRAMFKTGAYKPYLLASVKSVVMLFCPILLRLRKRA